MTTTTTFLVWFYFGVQMTEQQYKEACRKQAKGECPFCRRTGLTARYGNDKKHIAACERRPKGVR